MLKRKPIKQYLYVLYDAAGEVTSTYTGDEAHAKEEAEADCWGPRFRPVSTLVRYVRDVNYKPKKIPGA